jgi:hypothetical protein
METSKIIFDRSDIDLEPVTKRELIVLLHQLNNIDDNQTIPLTNNFVKELVRMSIDSFEDRKEEKDYES